MLGRLREFAFLCTANGTSVRTGLPQSDRLMEKFELNILGCGSAKPTTRHFPTSQVVNVRDKLYMIDCGEGAQIQFCRSHLKFTRLNRIFISHLHGDHCFGLPGLVSTLNLLGRTAELHIHCPHGFESIIAPMLQFFNPKMTYQVLFHEFDDKEPTVVFEDRSVSVTTIPLRHRIPCCGFLFREKPGQRHILRDMIDAYNIPTAMINRIKDGEDFVTADGDIIANGRLTTPADPPRSYAYCSDTVCTPDIVEQIGGVDLLFHEATYADADAAKAKERFHSTAVQAAGIARAAGAGKLVIGHFSARYDDETVLQEEAKAVFPNVVAAHENMRIEIKPSGQEGCPTDITR